MRGFRIYTQKESKNLQIKEVSDAEKEVYLHEAQVTKINCQGRSSTDRVYE